MKKKTPALSRAVAYVQAKNRTAWKFNVSLGSSVVSFEQPDPDSRNIFSLPVNYRWLTQVGGQIMIYEFRTAAGRRELIYSYLPNNECVNQRQFTDKEKLFRF